MHEFRRAWEQTTLERFLALTHQYHIDMKKFNEKTGMFEDVINDSMLNKSIIFNEQTGNFEYNANSYSLPAKRHRTYAHSQVYFAIQDIIVEKLGVDETDVGSNFIIQDTHGFCGCTNKRRFPAIYNTSMFNLEFSITNNIS